MFGLMSLPLDVHRTRSSQSVWRMSMSLTAAVKKFLSSAGRWAIDLARGLIADSSRQHGGNVAHLALLSTPIRLWRRLTWPESILQEVRVMTAVSGLTKTHCPYCSLQCGITLDATT